MFLLEYIVFKKLSGLHIVKVSAPMIGLDKIVGNHGALSLITSGLWQANFSLAIFGAMTHRQFSNRGELLKGQ